MPSSIATAGPDVRAPRKALRIADVYDAHVDFVARMAADLAANRGRCLVTAGAGQPDEVHAMVRRLNVALGNVPKTVDYVAHADAAGIEALAGEMKAGGVETLLWLERYQGTFLEQVLFPGRRVPDPSLLRTHPPTADPMTMGRSAPPMNSSPINTLAIAPISAPQTAHASIPRCPRNQRPTTPAKPKVSMKANKVTNNTSAPPSVALRILSQPPP